jgi:hypothetical protein
VPRDSFGRILDFLDRNNYFSNSDFEFFFNDCISSSGPLFQCVLLFTKYNWNGEVNKTCSTTWELEELILVIVGEAKRNETTRKTKA